MACGFERIWKKTWLKKGGTTSSGGLTHPAWKSGLRLRGRDLLAAENRFEDVLCLKGTLIPFTPTFTATHFPLNNFVPCTSTPQAGTEGTQYPFTVKLDLILLSADLDVFQISTCPR